MPTLPETPIAKGFLIRWSFSRGFALGTPAKLFRDCLFALEWFRFERWNSFTYDQEISFRTGMIPACHQRVDHR